MQSLKQVNPFKDMTSVRVSDDKDDRCDNVIHGYECMRKLFIDENGNKYCWHCNEVLKQDKQLAKETVIVDKKRKITQLYNTFADTSLINEKLKKATFSNYIAPTKELEEAKRYFEKFIHEYDPKEPTSILAIGDYGTGKSHLAVATTKEFMKRGHSAMFIQVNKMFTKIKSTWKKNTETSEAQLLELLATVELLVIDDFGAEFTDKDLEQRTWKSTTMNEIVDSRCGKATIFTTNFSIDKLNEMYGERDFSRMIQDAEPIEMYGENYRFKKFKKQG